MTGFCENVCQLQGSVKPVNFLIGRVTMIFTRKTLHHEIR